MMRSVFTTMVLVVGMAGAASAQTFLAPGALKDGTYGFFGPGEPMSLPAQGRSVSTGALRGECNAGDVVLCYPATFRTIADVAGQ